MPRFQPYKIHVILSLRRIRNSLPTSPVAWLAIGVIVACLLGEVAVLRVGIDDLDEGYFMQQAARVLQGQVPYRDFLTLYTPGLVYVHAAVFWALGGPYVLAPRTLALLARAALALLMYVMARPLVRNPLWAAAPAVLLLVGLDDAPERWEPHPGWLSTFFALLAAWCLSHQPTTRWLIGSGLAAGASYLFKQNTGVFILTALVVRGLLIGRLKPRERIKNILVIVASCMAFTAVWLAPLLLALRGQVTLLGDFVGAVNQAGLVSPPEPPVLVPLACLAGGVWLVRRCADERLRWYLLAGVAVLCTQYPRMDTLHLAWSAPLLLVVGAAVMDRLRPLAAGAVVLALAVLLWPIESSRLELIRDTNQRAPIALRFAAGLEVPQATAEDLQGVVGDIQRRTQPGEPIFVYPTSPLLYVLAERPNPTQFDHLNPGAADARQIEDVIADLQTASVRLIVISDFWQTAWGPPGPNAPLVAWLSNRFTQVARYGAYRVLAAGL